MSSTALHSRPAHFDLARSHRTTARFDTEHSSNFSNVQDDNIPSWFQGGLPTPPNTKDMTGISLKSNYGSYSQPQHYGNGYNHRQAYQTHSREPSDSTSTAKHAPSRYSEQAGSGPVDKIKANTIASHLQIPESINKSKGSLPDFAAEITCLFWFESAATLEYAEKLSVDTPVDRGLLTDATPTLGFRKWVTTILSTTQVGKNVILLALMFIYRLKKFNPSVSGKRGSEFRLLTIALMLGNKFLDDNTYTNKTWAEVSGISVTEIHIMEVEFLSNMRYELYASEADWVRWKNLLGKFGIFYERALRFQHHQDEQKQNPPITPTSQTFGYKLPSPPSGHLNPVHQINYQSLPNPMTTLPQLPRSPVRQYTPLGSLSERKRSIDSTDPLPPAKRPQYSMPPNVPSPVALLPGSDSGNISLMDSVAGHFGGTRVPQLPVPRLTPTPAGMSTHLAPLAPSSSRAMSSVYPPVTAPAVWSQSLTPLTAVTPMSAVPPSVTSQFQASMSPIEGPGGQSGSNSARTSPVNLYGPVTPTRQGLSPSFFLTNRSSPYRPVRHVNTLLIPPPSAAMQNPVRNIGFEQMHYQPIGRPSERHTGTVPYYQAENWAPSNVSTPTASLYRPF